MSGQLFQIQEHEHELLELDSSWQQTRDDQKHTSGSVRQVVHVYDQACVPVGTFNDQAVKSGIQ